MLKFHNIGVSHGVWGECVARKFLIEAGFDILEVNSRPYKKDKRLELDIVAVDKKSECLVFLEVKQHNRPSEYGSTRLNSIDKQKIMNLKKAANAWRWNVDYQGAYRFDVLQIYGTPESGVKQVIHTKDVRMFVRPERYVNWN